LGWGLLLVLLVQASTGIILTYDHAIDEFLNSSELRVKNDQADEFTSVDNIIKSVYSSVPNVVAITSLRKPRHNHTVYVVYPEFSKDSMFYGQKIEVLVNPYTAEITSVREWGKYFTSFIYSLHSTLLLSKLGTLVIGWLGILLFTSVIIGLYISWPKSVKAWHFYFSRSLPHMKHVNFWRKKHVQIGLILYPLLCVAFLSGVALSFNDYTSKILNVPQPKYTIDNNISRQGSLNIENLLQIITVSLPNYEWYRIKIPASVLEPIVINIRGEDDPRQSVGSSTVWMDRSTGEVLDLISYSDLSNRQKLASWFFPVHNGEFLENVGKFLAILTGIGSIWLVITAFFRLKTRLKRPV